MIKITINDNGKIKEVDSSAFLLIAFEEGAPRYGSISLMRGDFDEEMIDSLKHDFGALVEGEDSEDTEQPDENLTYLSITDADLDAQIKEIARKCAMTDAAVISGIVREALPYVKLTERRAYDKESAAQAPARRA